ncbi:heme-binding protein [Streptomyces sp. RS2]|uniref:GlcG/HbpS family heme-binding protein n=1 Tax=Streptomyces sp. RS2 TaxID=1451205 RepID=UPI0021F8A496|nr:heme-binding protein [Streptomyces sp. RS2]MCW1100165.1 heme-binding protein [Streptomyces sp. RS2]
MNVLTLERANEIVDAALSHARARELRPLAATVLDLGGHPLVVKREETAGILRPQLAHAKAWGCLGMGQGGAAGSRHATRDPAFLSALAVISDGRIAPSKGGLLIRDEDGILLGALGISGDRPDNDEAIAVFAVQKAGLVADVG